MSDISTIRSLIGDNLQLATDNLVGDGSATDFQTQFWPIVPNSQIVRVNGVTKSEGTDYTFDDAVGLCSFSVAPGNGQSVTVTSRFYLLSDDQLQDFLDLEGGTVKLAAADALDSIAASQALIQKKIKSLDLQTDGPALAEALHKLSAELRKQVLDPKFVASDFEIVEMVYDEPPGPSWTEKIEKDLMRQS